MAGESRSPIVPAPSGLTRVAPLALALASLAWWIALAATPAARAGEGGARLAAGVFHAACGRICHQQPDRSFASAGVPWPVCGRCTGLYGGALAGSWAAWADLRRRRRARRPVPGPSTWRLPLLAATERGGDVFLAVDAIETTPAFREDTHVGHPDLLEKKEYIFSRMVEEVEGLARAMGIDHVYAERFSNTAWVRRELERFPEVYLHIGNIQKIDELEDVFELSKRVCAAAGRERPFGIFMELQMKNTFLLPGAATVRGVKVFAVLAGDARLGMPMKRVFGV